MICEKPDAARRVAEALALGPPETLNMGTIPVLRLEDASGRRYIVCAAAGHLYGISDTVKSRRVYPVADLEWFPLGETGHEGAKFIAGRIRAISSLSREAGAFVNACDLDVEGETIGYNILKYACGGKEGSALRARFSSLTREEVAKAFREDVLVPGDGGAIAGRLRHAIDFLWGVNLSRALSESLRTQRSFRTVSMGRVQGPTLNFAVEKEVEVRTFVPTPYWTAKARFRKDGVAFDARYSTTPASSTERAADEVKIACEGRDGLVTSVARRTFRAPPPPPFSLADLQKEAFKLFGYSPSRTLQVAEKLYLGAMISYPRTGSQRLPRLDHGRLLSRLAAMPEYADDVNEVLSRGTPRAAEGRGTDPAHPAIYPTGEAPTRPLAVEERRVFDLVVRRFVSCFGEEAAHEASSAEISVGEHRFMIEETRVLVPGWMRMAPGWRPPDGRSVMAMGVYEGDRVAVEAVVVEERIRAHPIRYNQATLLEKMEREGIGTKATRADIISTLLERGYVNGENLVPTELGFALIDVMREYCPEIISTALTRRVEAELERIGSSGGPGFEFFEETLSSLLRQVERVRSHEGEIGGKMRSSIQGRGVERTILGGCPVCKDGKLWVVRSRKSGKRFVGCTNYSKGCRGSAPLPQRGAIEAASKPCDSCRWPVVYVSRGRRAWKLCTNERCPRKVNVYRMGNLRKRHSG